MTHAMAPLLKRFFSHYMPVQKGHSPNTVAAYRDAVKLLLCYVADTLKKSADELNVEDITEKVVLAFLDYIEQQRGCTVSTRNARLAAIRSLFAFIARENPELVLPSQQIRTIPLKRTDRISGGEGDAGGLECGGHQLAHGSARSSSASTDVQHGRTRQ